MPWYKGTSPAVAAAATAGESAYIRGDQGVGSIQKFTPRASGGKAYAGTTILAGENGPEPIT